MMKAVITGQLEANMREFWSERLLFRAELFLAIYDSVYYRERSHASSASGRRFSKWASGEANKNREQARAWIRDGSPEITDSTMGFGYVWSMLQTLGNMSWELDRFIECMERLWSEVDKDHSIGRRVITIMQGLQQETVGRAVVIDRHAEFWEIIGETNRVGR